MSRKVLLNSIKDLIEENSLFDLEKWHSFEIDFSINFERRKEIKELIFENIEKKTLNKNANGLYAIYSLENKLLYVGKGQPIGNRLFDHYSKAQGINYNVKYKNWFNFFNQNCKCKIYCSFIELDLLPDNKVLSDKLRGLIEQVILSENSVEFESFRKQNV